MTDTCALHIDTQSDSRSLTELIAQQVQASPPLLAWAEPDPLAVDLTNRSGRRDDFTPLQRGVPSWPPDVPLIEARLFWADTALHVIAQDGGGCRWTRITEDATADLSTTRTRLKVHIRSDWARFGLAQQQPIADLQAIEYRQNGRLIAWRLIVANKEHRDA